MQIANISLAYLIAELKPIAEGSILRKVQELGNGWLKLRLQTRQGSKDLIAAPSAVFLTEYSLPAKQTTSGYGAFLRKRLTNKKVVSFEQHQLDRIVVMHFDEFFLIFELFAKGNVILADRQMMILSAFRKERWKDRTLRKGEQYKFPSSKGINPSELDEAKLKSLLKESDLDVVRALIREVNIAPAFAEAACSATGLEKEMPASKLHDKEAKRLAETVKDLYSVDLRKEQPLLAKKDGKQTVLPFPLPLPGVRVLQRFPSVNEVIDSIYSKRFAEGKTVLAKETIGRKKALLQRSMQQQKEALQPLQQRIEENTKKAELIYANYAKLFELIQAVEAAAGQKLPEKEIMYKLKRKFPFLQSLNLKGRKLVVRLQK